MKQTKKETWDIALGRTDKHEKLEFILPTLEWLKSKGCDKIFYPCFSHYDLFLVEDLNWWKEQNNNIKITFNFNAIFLSKSVLNAIDIIKSNQISEEEEKVLLEMEQKCKKKLSKLLIEIKTQTEHYSHITQVNEYDEFEIILDKIMTNYT